MIKLLQRILGITALKTTVDGYSEIIDKLQQKVNEEMAAIDDLKAQVDANVAAEAAAIAKIQTLADAITAHAGDDAVLVELAAKLKASADALAAHTA